MVGIVERLAAQWRGPTVEVEPRDDGLLVTTWDDLIDRPFDLDLGHGELRRFVDALGPDDVAALWPGRTQEWAAFALLSVHLEELLATAEARPTRVALRDGRLVVVAAALR